MVVLLAVQPTLDIAVRIALALSTNLSRMLHTSEKMNIVHMGR
ncbi:unnamed protein product [marine sediment metagenome]|uniref:Uncharacterized protein n=1 Tax=marine sediment metagenome TaxID=412755 RepID=X1BBQ7_9ZZZZ